MKKVGFMLILMLVAVSLLVVGCGGEEEANPTATSTVNPTATQPTATSAQPTETTGPTPPTTTSTPAATAATTLTPAATAAITPTPAATAATTPTPAATAATTSTPAATTTTTPTGGTLTFNDDFNGIWDPSWWYWTDPNDDATYDFTAHTGFLRLTVPADNDLAGITNYDAPRLWFPYNGNFALETLVEFDPQEIYQGAGLLVWQDENSFLRIEFGFGGMGGEAKNVVFVKQEEGSLILVNGVDLPNTVESIELRLQRDGNQFTAWYRQVGGSWHEIGSTELILALTVDVGITQITQYTTSEISADFDYFKLFVP